MKHYEGMGLGTIVDKTWAFIPAHDSNEKRFVCLFDNGSEKYLFLANDFSYGGASEEFKQFFSGKLYEMPEADVLKREDEHGLFNLLVDGSRSGCVMPQEVKDVACVPDEYVSSLAKYICEELG